MKYIQLLGRGCCSCGNNNNKAAFLFFDKIKKVLNNSLSNLIEPVLIGIVDVGDATIGVIVVTTEQEVNWLPISISDYIFIHLNNSTDDLSKEKISGIFSVEDTESVSEILENITRNYFSQETPFIINGEEVSAKFSFDTILEALNIIDSNREYLGITEDITKLPINNMNALDLLKYPGLLIILNPYRGHAYVEIADIKWATVNIGAASSTDYGLYFLWGDSQGYTVDQIGNEDGLKYFNWANYKYATNSTPTAGDMLKYNDADNKIVLDADDDAVTVAWGGNWRMPTKEDFDMLIRAVNTEFVNDYQNTGIPGLVLADKTDRSKVLFFPAAGCILNGNTNGMNSSGHYWSSSIISEGDSKTLNSYKFYFNNLEVNLRTNTRYFGCQVRGVAD